MGGLIKAITPPSVSTSPSPPLSTSPSSQAATAAAATAAAATDTAAADQQRRIDALARQRAGRAGTIATSSRGLLVPAEWMPARKSLLGE